MSSAFKAVQVSDSVWWVGAIDWDLTDFHGYETTRGSTYNAFLVIADKITLIDTVKKDYTDELLSRISSFIHPSRIDYIISNHSEMDHTGALPEIIRTVQPEKIFASAKGVATLKDYNLIGEHNEHLLEAVKDNQVLDLGGGHTIRFLDTKMVHWPDSMFSYLESEKVLFSNDAFGMHLASFERYVDELDPWIVNYEATKYYANIFWPLSPAVSKAVKKTRDSIGVGNIKVLAPDHGPLFRKQKDMESIFNSYDKWIAGEVKKHKVVITFATMWESTAKMARAIAEGAASEGVDVKFCPLSRTHRSDVSTELLEGDALIIGSPNLNSGIYPTVADTLTYLKGLKPASHKLLGGVFGSYGWSPASLPQLSNFLEEMKVEVFEGPVKTKYAPSKDVLLEGFEYGRAFAAKLKEND